MLVITEDTVYEVKDDKPLRSVPVCKLKWIVRSQDHPGDFIIHPDKAEDIRFVDKNREGVMSAL